MVIEGLQKFFSACPYFSSKRVNVNFLGHKEGDVSIEPVGGFSVIKKYCDGKRVFEQELTLSIRCGFDENISLNLKDAALMESVCAWIDEQNRKGNLPKTDNGYKALDITVTKAPHLYESSVQGARMQMQLSLTYREV